MTESAEFRPHSSHWGAFTAAWQDGELVVRPHADDPDPNRILQEFPARPAASRRASPGR